MHCISRYHWFSLCAWLLLSMKARLSLHPVFPVGSVRSPEGARLLSTLFMDKTSASVLILFTHNNKPPDDGIDFSCFLLWNHLKMSSSNVLSDLFWFDLRQFFTLDILRNPMTKIQIKFNIKQSQWNQNEKFDWVTTSLLCSFKFAMRLFP